MMSFSVFSQDGVVHFTGAIVNAPCEIKKESNDRVIDTECYKNGKMFSTKRVVKDETYENNVFSSTTESVPGHKNLKIMTISYK